jgi:hypothetical protein
MDPTINRDPHHICEQPADYITEMVEAEEERMKQRKAAAANKPGEADKHEKKAEKKEDNAAKEQHKKSEKEA